MKGVVPRFSGPDHGIEDGQELAHASDDGDLLRLADGNETLVEMFDDGVEADSHQGCHVEASAYLAAPAEDGPLSPHLSRVAIEGSNTYQGADFPARQSSQLWHLRDQAGGGGRADTAYTGQPLSKIGMMGLDVPGEIGLDLIELGTNRLEYRFDALAGSGMADRQTLVLCHTHGDKLPAARYQGLKHLLFRCRQGTDEAIPLRMVGQDLGEFSQGLGVNTVGFGEMGLGEVPRLAGIDDGHGKRLLAGRRPGRAPDRPWLP